MCAMRTPCAQHAHPVGPDREIDLLVLYWQDRYDTTTEEAAVSGPKHAESSRSGRLYSHPVTGETALSVTTVLGDGIPKKALPGWAARTAAEYATANIHELAKLVDEGGVSFKEAIDRIKGAPWRQRDNKADIGTAVHDVAELLAGKPAGSDYELDLAEYDESIHGYLLSLLGWFEKWEPIVEATETTVWSRQHGYAGTLDLICSIPSRHPDGGFMLLDFKTSKVVYGETALQLAAYAHADFVLLDDGTEHDIPGPIVELGVVHITPDGNPARLYPVEHDPSLFDVFLDAKAIAGWTRDDSRTAIGKPL